MIRASQLVVRSLQSLATSPIRHAALAAHRRSLFTASRPMMMAEVWLFAKPWGPDVPIWFDCFMWFLFRYHHSQANSSVATMLAQEAKQQQIMREAFRAQMLSMLASKTYCMNDFVREMKVACFIFISYRLLRIILRIGFACSIFALFVSLSLARSDKMLTSISAQI